MVSYNFQPQFADKIVARTKTFTMRKDGIRRHPQAGGPLHLYTGMRTSKATLILGHVVPCTFRATVRIYKRDSGIQADRHREKDSVWIDPASGVMNDFVRADGFDDLDAFMQFHKPSGAPSVVWMELIAWGRVPGLYEP
jgi:hypothetical protein